jgi:hypothetical protein
MNNFFVAGTEDQRSFTHVTVLGVALICVVLIALFYYLFVNDKFVEVRKDVKPDDAKNTVADATRAATFQTGMALRWQDNDTSGVGAATFSTGYEPPVFWGDAEHNVLYQDQRSNLAAEGRGANNQVAGFRGGSDFELLQRAQGGR